MHAGIVPRAITTFGLPPDGTLTGLNDLEAVVALAAQAPSLEAAANMVRRDPLDLLGAVRWLRRRVQFVQRCLVLAIGLVPERFSG